jgi:hypothetical protein
MIILLNNLEPKKSQKKAKKAFYEKLKNTSYDTLNKRSVSIPDVKEISVEDFIYFLDGTKSYNEL